MTINTEKNWVSTFWNLFNTISFVEIETRRFFKIMKICFSSFSLSPSPSYGRGISVSFTVSFQLRKAKSTLIDARYLFQNAVRFNLPFSKYRTYSNDKSLTVFEMTLDIFPKRRKSGITFFFFALSARVFKPPQPFSAHKSSPQIPFSPLFDVRTNQSTCTYPSIN